MSIFTPYHGTKLRELAVERGYLDDSVITTHPTSSSLLNMPPLSSKDIDGLMRTFACYVRFPKEEWPRIGLAEQDMDEGNRIFEEYHRRYTGQFFQGTQEVSMEDWDAPSEYVVAPGSDGPTDDRPWGWNCGAERKEYVVPSRASTG